MFKNINWGLVIILFVAGIASAVIAQLLVKETSDTDGSVKRTLSIGSKKSSATE
ncbi:MAG: hypothetical protein LC105_05440 [Chitinophagales bacterium]|nr:hypothetical protein [Chitinophagales bacterium]MCZ2393278.1 hypothetical protein [Chitinophagales bacterium]